jgi:hypothetical protein
MSLIISETVNRANTPGLKEISQNKCFFRGDNLLGEYPFQVAGGKGCRRHKTSSGIELSLVSPPRQTTADLLFSSRAQLPPLYFGQHNHVGVISLVHCASWLLDCLAGLQNSLSADLLILGISLLLPSEMYSSLKFRHTFGLSLFIVHGAVFLHPPTSSS